ncbi:Uncharacterised protein [Salmonella enterica subsp. enterica serovar Bovismorbificans]|nr:Uncharacterised protein [Salmonella enterica subsp. enterica serovar Bovismorbificans]
MVFIFHRRKVVALVEFTEVDFTTGLRIPQPQSVSGVGVVTGDDLIIRDGQNLFRLNPARFFTFLLNAPAKKHLIARIVALELPRVAIFQPVIRRFFLPPVDNILLKHAVIVANAIPATR